MEIQAVSFLTYGAQPPPSNCRIIYFLYSEFDRFCDLSTCQNLPVLYPRKVNTTLAQKLFRREPAITRFDQLITPYLKSSERIAQLYRSDLHLSFDKLHPAQGKLIWLRVLCILHIFRAIHTRFPFDSGLSTLACNMHKLVGSFFNRHAGTELHTEYY